MGNCGCKETQNEPVDQNKKDTPRNMKQPEKLPSLSENVK